MILFDIIVTTQTYQYCTVNINTIESQRSQAREYVCTINMSQPLITSFIVSNIGHKRKLDDMEQEKKDNVLQNKDEKCKIYAYCRTNSKTPKDWHKKEIPYYDPTIHENPAYVGLTIREVLKRDGQHFYDNKTKFDQEYTSRSVYQLVLFETKTFPKAANDKDYKKETLEPAAKWMDEREVYYIKLYDTYTNGCNCTKGGQNGSMISLKEAMARQSYINFRDKYMPRFQECYDKRDTINISQRDKEFPDVAILVNHMRTRNTKIPYEFKDKLRELGFDDKNQNDVKSLEDWENIHMPAIETYSRKYGHINIPQKNTEFPKTCILFDHIRRDHTKVSDKFKQQLIDYGFIYDLNNLYNHIKFVIGRTPGHPEHDIDVRNALLRVSNYHKYMMGKKVGKSKKELVELGIRQLPFGTKPLGDGIDRFLNDMELAAKKP